MRRQELTYLEAIRDGLRRAMRDDPRVVVFGEDVGQFGGAFKLTAGLQEEFGEERVFDTPVSESAILGGAVGMALVGLRPVAELQFADFGMTAFHQILANAGTTHYRTGHAVPMTVRAPCGGGFGGGPFHSEELEAFFCHVPGIKVVYPAFPSDARGLIYSAIFDDNPVIFLENKYLYRRARQLLPERFEPEDLGAARVCRDGEDAVIITYGAMVHEALQAAEELAGESGYEVMVLDLRTLKPYDRDAILAAAAATNRVMVVHEAWQTGGFGAEITAFVSEQAFHLLDAPPVRVAAPDVPIPFAPTLEAAYRPSAGRIKRELMNLIEY